MKKIIAIIVGTVLLVGLIAGATAIYNDYMEENRPSNIVIIGGKEDKTDATLSTDTEIGTETEAFEQDSGTETEAFEQDSSTETNLEGESDSFEHESAQVTDTEAKNDTETETEYVSPYLAPDFTVYDINGTPVKLSDYRGKPIVMNFWASDCYYCVEEMPDFQKAYEKYGDQVEFLMICHVGFANRTPAYEKDFIDRKGYTFPLYFDTQYNAVYTYGISAVPQTFFIDKNFDLYTYIPGMADYASLEYCINLILD